MASRALVPFLVSMMLLTGVCNTLLTKYQVNATKARKGIADLKVSANLLREKDMQCIADCNSKRPKTFEQPVLQTLQMFIGESGCWLVVFVGYLVRRIQSVNTTTPAQDTEYERINTADPDESDRLGDDEDFVVGMNSSQTLVDATNIVAKPLFNGDGTFLERRPLKGLKIMILALPAICDILGTTLMNVGLLFVAASIYQMTRGALVLFVGLFSVVFLKRDLHAWKWASLFVVVSGVAIVGLAGALDSMHESLPSRITPSSDLKWLTSRASREEGVSTSATHTAAETILGVMLIAGAQIFTASQFVLEESIMEKFEMDPIQVVGWEGVFGFIVTLLSMGVLHLAIGRTPQGQGGYFDAREGLEQVINHRGIAISSILIMISIGGFNFFGLSVTRVISATSRSTIDTCRTLFIWLVSLGLGWESFKWLQVLGFAFLVWGTAVFNDIVRPPTVTALRRALGAAQSRSRAEA